MYFLFSRNVAYIPAPLEDIPERNYVKGLSPSPSSSTWIRWLACAGGRDQVNSMIQNILITTSVANNVFFLILEYRFPHQLNKSSELKSFLEEPWRLRSQNARKGSGESPQLLRRMPIFDPPLEENIQEIHDGFFFQKVTIQCLSQTT